MPLAEQITQLARQTGHLLCKGFTVVLLLGDAYIASGREDIVLFGDIIQRSNSAETFLVLERTSLKLTESVCNAEDVFLGQFTQFACNHRTHITGIHKEHFARLLLIAVDEPQTNRNTRRIEELVRHSHNTFHQIRFDDVCADISFTACL